MRPIKMGAALKAELEAVASEELAGPLYFADNLEEASQEDRQKLRDYLLDEMKEGGMLSVGKAEESGSTLGQERIQARRLIDRL